MMDELKKKILIVEDDDLIRQLFAGELIKAGLEVTSFALGAEGMKALEEQKFDLVLLDIMLPDVNGLEIIKHVRKSTGNSEATVVMLTNLGQDNVISEAYKLGANGFLIKSAYSPDQIVEEIKKILEQPPEAPVPSAGG